MRWGVNLGPGRVTVMGGSASNIVAGFSTNFDGPDADPIGAPWVTTANGIRRVGNEAFGRVPSNPNAAIVGTVTVGPVHYAQIEAGVVSNAQGTAYSAATVDVDPGAGNAVCFGCFNGTNASVLQIVGGSGAYIYTTSRAHTPGDVYRIESLGNGDYRLLVDGVELTTITAPSYNPGTRCGVLVQNSDCSLLSFAMGDGP